MSEANMENLLKEYLRLSEESEAIEDKIHPLIHKWCKATNKWYSYVRNYGIEEDLSFWVNYMTNCWGGNDSEQTTIPKEYFLAADKDAFIANYLEQKKLERARAEAEEEKARAAKEEAEQRAKYEELKKKFDN